MKTFNVVLTFESVDKILWFDYSAETCLAVLLHGCFLIFKQWLRKKVDVEALCMTTLGI